MVTVTGVAPVRSHRAVATGVARAVPGVVVRPVRLVLASKA